MALTDIRPADACLHASRHEQKPTPVTQKGQQALILHHAGVQDLILKVEYNTGETAALAWIVPVPAVPTEYGAVDGKLFDALAGWVNLRRGVQDRRRRAKGIGGDGAKEPVATLTLLPPAAVGPFDIQPIQARGKAAGSALNAWMTERGFGALPDETLAYYIERNWTFLAVRVSPDKGKKTMAKAGGLPPLRITFPSAQAVYPLKLSTHMGEFAARVYLVTADILATNAFAGARARGFEVVSNGMYFDAPHTGGALRSDVGHFMVADAPESVRALLSKRFADKRQLSLAVLLGERVNDSETISGSGPDGVDVRRAPADWSEDLAVPALPDRTIDHTIDHKADHKPDAHVAQSPTDKANGSGTGSTPDQAAEKTAKKKKKTKSSGCAASTPAGSGLAWSLLGLVGVFIVARRRRDLLA